MADLFGVWLGAFCHRPTDSPLIKRMSGCLFLDSLWLVLGRLAAPTILLKQAFN